MSSITFYTASGQSAFNAVTTIGAPVWEDAIPELNSRLVFSQPFMQLGVSFSPLAIGTAYGAHGTDGVPATPTYYLVGENGFSDERAGILKWNRRFACVPASWSETQEFAYTFPAFYGSITIGSSAPITGITYGGGTTYIQVSTTLTPITVGDQIYVACSYIRGGATYAIQMFTRVAVNSTGSVVGIPPILPGTGDFISEGGTMQLAGARRLTPLSKIVGSRIANDYAIGAEDTLESVLPLIDKFTPMDNLGNETDIILPSGYIGQSTNPTTQQYQTWMATNSEIVAETSTRERWLGNIYVRKTRLVPAK